MFSLFFSPSLHSCTLSCLLHPSTSSAPLLSYFSFAGLVALHGGRYCSPVGGSLSPPSHLACVSRQTAARHARPRPASTEEWGLARPLLRPPPPPLPLPFLTLAHRPSLPSPGRQVRGHCRPHDPTLSPVRQDLLAAPGCGATHP